MSKEESTTLAELLRAMGYRCGSSTTDHRSHFIVLVDGSEVHAVGEVAAMLEREIAYVAEVGQ